MQLQILSAARPEWCAPASRPAVLFGSPLAALALTLLVPLVLML